MPKHNYYLTSSFSSVQESCTLKSRVAGSSKAIGAYIKHGICMCAHVCMFLETGHIVWHALSVGYQLYGSWGTHFIYDPLIKQSWFLDLWTGNFLQSGVDITY